MTEGVAIIDVWDVKTFDSELRGDLDTYTDIIRGYMLISRHQRLEHEASDHNMLCIESLYAGETILVKERTMRLMKSAPLRGHFLISPDTSGTVSSTDIGAGLRPAFAEPSRPVFVSRTLHSICLRNTPPEALSSSIFRTAVWNGPL